MKKILFWLFALFAGGLTASARVSWIPMTTNEIVSFKQEEMNDINVTLFRYNADGSASIDSSMHDTHEPNEWFRSGTWNLFTETSNHITEVVTRCMTSTNNPGTNRFFVLVCWTAWWDGKGSNIDMATFKNGDGYFYGDIVSGVSPDFQFASAGLAAPNGVVPNGVVPPPIPPEAYNIQADWVGDTLILPEVGQGIRWVEWFVPDLVGSDGFDMLSRNGLPYAEAEWLTTNGVLYILSHFVEMGASDAFNPDCDMGNTNVAAIYSLWYNEERTDGTQWLWYTCGRYTKREVYPLSLTSSIVNGGVQLSVSGATAGGLYVIEGKSGLTTNLVALVESDTNGTAEWIVPSTNGIVYSVRPAGTNEFPANRLVLTLDGQWANLFLPGCKPGTLADIFAAPVWRPPNPKLKVFGAPIARATASPGGLATWRIARKGNSPMFFVAISAQ